MTIEESSCENCAFKNKCEKYKHCKELEKKLEIAVEALGHYSRKGSLAQEALAKIKEIK